MERVKVEAVTYSYRTKYQTIQALTDVSCTFETEKMYAIVGESVRAHYCLCWLVLICR